MSFVAVVVDDVAREAHALAEMIRTSPQFDGAEVVELTTASDLRSYLTSGRPLDVLFVDVCLGEKNGIELVERLQAAGRGAQVVYVSGYDEFHTRVYATPHASFVRKPLHQEDVELALGQALARREAATAEPLVLRHDHVVDVVRPQDIGYVESNRLPVLIHAGSATHRLYGKRSVLLDGLPGYFVRCHQSYAINLDYVERLSAESVLLATGESIPVSRRWRTAVREALFSRVREGRSCLD